MDHHSQRMLLPHSSISESIELSSTATPTSSLQMRSHRRVLRRPKNSTNKKNSKINIKNSTIKNHNEFHSIDNESLIFCSYICWSLISFISSLIMFAGFWAPYWIEGDYFENIHATFGPFKRCNYPHIEPKTGRLTIITNCSRYLSFQEIPSLYWQISTILSSFSIFLLFFVTFILFVSCCWKLSSKNALTIIKLQFFSILLILIACLVFPYGMTIPEVTNVCGSIKLPIDFGICQISNSIYLFIVSTLLSLLSILFGVFSSKILKNRELQILQNEEFV